MLKLEALKNNIYRALIDCWAILFVIIVKIIFLDANKLIPTSKLSKKSFNKHFCWLVRQIVDVNNPDEYEVKKILFCYTTLYAILMLCMFTFMLLTIIIYSFDHKLYTVLAFTVATMAVFFEIQHNYNFYTQIAIMSLFILYALYRIEKSFDKANPGSKIVAETADSFLQFGFSFYIKLIIQFTLIYIKSIFIRLLNFKSKSYGQKILMALLLYYYSYSELFVTQAFTAQTLSRKVYNDSPSFAYEVIAMFFTTSAVALVKIFFIFTNTMYYIAFEIFGTNFIRKNKFMKAFEDDRCFFFYIIFVRTSFFEGFFNWRRNFWQGELKKNMRKLSLKQDGFPLIVIMYVCFKTMLKNYTIIRPVELFFIIPCNAFVVIEIFNTYAVMKILECAKTTYYSNKSLKNVKYNHKGTGEQRKTLQVRKNAIKLHDFFNNNFFNKKLIEGKEIKTTFGYFDKQDSNSQVSSSENTSKEE
ncbi:hypothetical protein NUSPORA_00228 [Nucleospora cyclopteri]